MGSLFRVFQTLRWQLPKATFPKVLFPEKSSQVEWVSDLPKRWNPKKFKSPLVGFQGDGVSILFFAPEKGVRGAVVARCELPKVPDTTRVDTQVAVELQLESTVVRKLFLGYALGLISLARMFRYGLTAEPVWIWVFLVAVPMTLYLHFRYDQAIRRALQFFNNHSTL